MSMAVLKRLANRIFVTGPYQVAKDGSVEAEIPHRCPQARLDGTCRIKKFGTRKRICGMGYPLWICLCVAHKYHFTVYPPGWIPYARNPIVQLTPDGKPIEVLHPNANCEEWLRLGPLRFSNLSLPQQQEDYGRKRSNLESLVRPCRQTTKALRELKNAASNFS